MLAEFANFGIEIDVSDNENDNKAAENTGWIKQQTRALLDKAGD